VDSDDWISKDFFNILYVLISENNCDIAECGYKNTYGAEDVCEDTTGEITFYDNIGHLKNLYINHNETVVIWNKLYKKSLFSEIRFPVGKVIDDEFITYKLIYLSEKIIHTGRKMYYYFQSDNSVMRKKFSISRLDAILAFEEQVLFFKRLYRQNSGEDYSWLYKNSLFYYMHIIVKSYFQVKKHIKDNKEIIKSLRLTYRKCYKVVMESNLFSLKNKFMYTLFKIWPPLLSLYRFFGEMKKAKN
jgi:hypothetical protein